MRQRFWLKVVLAILLSAFMVPEACAQQPQKKKGLLGESPLRGRIVEVNEGYRFVVINIGGADGVKKGLVFNVFQRDEEVAKIKVVRARRYISACDIQVVYTSKGIQAGDLVVVEQTSALINLLRPLESTRMTQVEPIVVDIDAPRRTIFQKAQEVFAEFSTMIMELDNSSYSFKAQKYLEMPLAVSVVTEWGPQVKSRVFYTVEVSPAAKYNRLIIRLREVYDKEGQLYNRQTERVSFVYKEACEMAFRIRELAEEL